MFKDPSTAAGGSGFFWLRTASVWGFGNPEG